MQSQVRVQRRDRHAALRTARVLSARRLTIRAAEATATLTDRVERAASATIVFAIATSRIFYGSARDRVTFASSMV